MMSLPGGDTLTILVVEDDAAVAELLREVLNDVPGWGATVVHDAAAARAVFHYVKIDVMVLDLNLPGISGLELLELLRRDTEWRDPPVILISAAPAQPGVHEALEHGAAVRIIAKPFDVDQLVQVVHVAAESLDAGAPR
jgi:DNA-binding response OmpR family regulator